MQKTLVLMISLGGLLSCSQGVQNDFSVNSNKSVEEIESFGKVDNASIIRNPATANQSTDTVNVAKMTFEEEVFNFGEVETGEVVSHTYSFTNTGKVPLIITDARSSCGCTVPEWPTEPIAPGKNGELKVNFNTKSKYGRQEKPIIITANTYPGTTTVYLQGRVNRKDQNSIQ